MLKLIEKAKDNGIKVAEVIDGMAYVSDGNLEVCGREIILIARINTAVAAAANGNLEEGFCFNKDAGMLQCPAGGLSMRVEKRAAKNLERLKFEESEYFRERMKIRCRIEEKNGELKETHGLRRADSRGLFAMHLQMYFTAFAANIKRIIRLQELAVE